VEQEGRRTMRDFSLREHFRDGHFFMHHGSIAGCVGGLYENICAARNILREHTGVAADCSLHLFPASQPVYHQLAEAGVAAELSAAGAVLLSASCGPCFGVQDIPANNHLSMRHITRNFLNREGARPSGRQSAGVVLMDARSIAATLCTGGRLTGADALAYDETVPPYRFEEEIYRRQVYWGYGRADHTTPIALGPNITDWPELDKLPRHLLLQVSGVYEGSVTTDELVPSGEASAYRSNPERLATFTLQNRDPQYYQRAKMIRTFSQKRHLGQADAADAELSQCCRVLETMLGCARDDLEVCSVLLCNRIGDGSAREQAASSQRILGGRANIAVEYVTKRYRSNLINWGMLPLLTDQPLPLKEGDLLLLRDIRAGIQTGAQQFTALHISRSGKLIKTYPLHCTALSEDEKELLLAGCLINRYRRIP